MTRMLLVAVVIAALWCSGCGSGQPTSAGNPAHPKTFVLWDATGAINTIPSYKQELISTIQHVAAEREEIFAAVIDGQPITTAAITARNFGEAPPDTQPQEQPAINQAVAEGFARDFVATFAKPETVRGSGQLQGLLIAAGTPGVHEIIMFTDAIVNEAGFDLTYATPAELAAEVARWKPKLASLKGKRVVVIGAGRGVHRVVTVEHAYQLFHALVEGNDGKLEWLMTGAQR
jgi:hypothetical protein